MQAQRYDDMTDIRDSSRPRRDVVAVRALESPPARFLLVGIANTAVGLAVIYAAKWLGAADVPANVLGYGVGLCLSFTLNRSWTFGYEGSTGPALARFLLVFAVAYALNLLTVTQAIDLFGINGYLAQALGIVPYTLFTYLASRHFAFRKPPSDAGRSGAR